VVGPYGCQVSLVAQAQRELPELKEKGIVRVNWTSGESNDVDLFTENLPGPAFNKHAVKFVGENVGD